MDNTGTVVSLSQIGQISIIVKDVARATQFYRDVLGMKFLFEAPNLAFFDAGGVRLMLGKAEKPEFERHASILYYKVADIGQAHQALANRGVKVEHDPQIIAKMPDHDLWLSFYKDSEDNHFALMSEVPRLS
jgi:predicted enzyme related to lactoylglutathione lyase